MVFFCGPHLVLDYENMIKYFSETVHIGLAGQHGRVISTRQKVVMGNLLSTGSFELLHNWHK